jgi:adenosylhomocysteine nucleosidase
MIKLGILGPSEREIMPFIEKISDVDICEHAMLKFYSGIYKGVDVVSAFCGVCKVNAAIATQILISEFKVTHIVLAGVAGALNDQLKIGDIVISSEVAYHDVASGILTNTILG